LCWHRALREARTVTAVMVWGSHLERAGNETARKLTPGLSWRDLIALSLVYDLGGEALPSQLVGPVVTTAPGVSTAQAALYEGSPRFSTKTSVPSSVAWPARPRACGKRSGRRGEGACPGTRCCRIDPSPVLSAGGIVERNTSTSALKVCRRCGVEKPASDFHGQRRNRDKVSSWCKLCVYARTRQWRAEKREGEQAETDARRPELIASINARHRAGAEAQRRATRLIQRGRPKDGRATR
jgi:hypothetical protein